MSTKETAIAQDLCEFFEVIVHNILYHRGIYPKSMFIIRKAYGLPVYEIVHPNLKEYISKTFESVLFYLISKTLEHISLDIFINKIPFEKYKVALFEVNDDLSKYEYDSLEQVFQKFYSTIGSAVKSLKRAPKDVSFRIDVRSTKNSVASFYEGAIYTHSPSNKQFDHDVRTHLFEFEDVKLHLFVEENCNGLHGQNML